MWHLRQRVGIVACGILHLILEEFSRRLSVFFGLFWQMHSSGQKVNLSPGNVKQQNGSVLIEHWETEV